MHSTSNGALFRAAIRRVLGWLGLVVLSSSAPAAAQPPPPSVARSAPSPETRTLVWDWQYEIRTYEIQSWTVGFPAQPAMLSPRLDETRGATVEFHLLTPSEVHLAVRADHLDTQGPSSQRAWASRLDLTVEGARGWGLWIVGAATVAQARCDLYPLPRANVFFGVSKRTDSGRRFGIGLFYDFDPDGGFPDVRGLAARFQW